MNFKQQFDVGRFTCTAMVDAPGNNRALAVAVFRFAPAAGVMTIAECTLYQQAKEATLRQAAVELGIAPLVVESTAPARSRGR